MKGQYLLSTADPKLQISPTTVMLAKKGEAGDFKEITLSSSYTNPRWANISIKSLESGIKADYVDEIVISAWRSQEQ